MAVKSPFNILEHFLLLSYKFYAQLRKNVKAVVLVKESSNSLHSESRYC